MQNVTNALLNFILVSIPEEIFLVVMTLIFMKRFDLLDVRMWKQNLKWFAIPVLPVALMTNVFRYIIVIPRPLMSLSALILMNILIIYLIIKKSFNINKKIIFKTIIGTMLSFVLLSLFEIIYTPITLSLLHKSIEFINNNITYNFLISLPSRVMEYCLVIFILVKKNNNIKINLFEAIIKNKFFTVSFLTIIILLNLVIIYLAKLITINSILINLNIIDQLIITSLIIAFPLLLITWFLLFVNYLLTKEKQIQQTYENLIIQDDVTADVDD